VARTPGPFWSRRVGDDGADDAAVIREQIQFYREVEVYDGDVGDLAAEAFNDRVLACCPVSTRCLELASGSGSWTVRLLGPCERIAAVDSSPERHAFSRARIADPRVEYIEANLFEFRPPAKYDLVFRWLLALARPAGTSGILLGHGRGRARTGGSCRHGWRRNT